MVHFGKLRCGKVDHFAGLFHVVTEFLHANFIPLLPLRSVLVLRSPSAKEPDTDVPLPLCWKSVWTGWLRATLVVLLLLSVVKLSRDYARWVEIPPPRRAAAVKPETRLAAVVDSLALTFALAVFLGLSYRLTRASWNRAVELAAVLGLSEDDLDAYLAGDFFPARAALPLDAEEP